MLFKSLYYLCMVLICGGIGYSAPPAMAQTSMPEFYLSESNSFQDMASDNLNTQFDVDIKRQITKDIFALRQQINLLTILITRQSEIQKIAKNYDDIGVQFKQPLPDIDVCRKLPVNILCLYSYPNLDTNVSLSNLVEDRVQVKNQAAYESALQAYTAAQSQFMASDTNIDDFSDDTLDEDIINAQEIMSPPVQDMFSWEDIRCRLDECSVLIRSMLDPSFMRRLNTGDPINETIKIAHISPTTVKIKTPDDIVTIPPLRLDGTHAMHNQNKEPAEAEKDVSSAVERLNSVPRTSEINQIIDNATPQSVDLGPTPPETNETPVLLGPTGLF